MATPLDPSYREIRLTQGQVALVDAEDHERIAKHSWYAAWAPSTQSYYAVRRVTVAAAKQIGILMHREVMGLEPGDKRQVDHAFHRTLDNRKFVDGKQNLRITSSQKNGFNRCKSRKSTSGYKGAHWRNDRKKWRAEIRIDGKLIHLGLFERAEDAGAAYRIAAEKLHGEFAHSICYSSVAGTEEGELSISREPNRSSSPDTAHPANGMMRFNSPLDSPE